MRNLSDTITRLSAFRKAAEAAGAAAPGSSSRLADIGDFGSNPGALRGWAYVPPGLGAGAPLVVVLHGCTQTAAGYDRGAGWSQVADELGFALLFPEQQRANNPNLCFNWFEPDDNRRDRGEALSIRQMIAKMTADHALDPGRVFVTGLSAGGAMAAAMLATYPELFAGGAIIAGIPYGAASNVPQAFDRMRGHGLPPAEVLAARVRRASRHQGPWPVLSVWHGGADATVAPSNADAIVDQWLLLHGLEASLPHLETVDGHPRRVWRDAGGRDVVEAFSITGMGHGTPLATTGADPCGSAGAFMIEASISSTRHIAAFWGLSARAAGMPPKPSRPVVNPAPDASAAPLATQVGKVIEEALRTAGLIR